MEKRKESASLFVRWVQNLDHAFYLSTILRVRVRRVLLLVVSVITGRIWERLAFDQVHEKALVFVVDSRLNVM